MPPVPVPNDGYFLGTIADLQFRMASLETQQQSVISNMKGQPVLAFGLSPGSDPPQWGLQLLGQAFGTEVGFLGEDAAGNTALKFRNSAGDVVVQIDVTGVHIYNTSGTEIVTLDASGLTAGGVTVNASGLTAGPVTLTSAGLAAGGGVEVNANGLAVYNGSTLEVQVGEVSSSPSIYGLAVRPYGGSTLQLVAGSLSVAAPAASSVTAATWTNFGSPSSLTVEVGPSGVADVSVQSYLATGIPGEQAFVGVSVDGGTPYEFLELSTTSTGGGVSGTIGSSYLWSALTAGTHTFQLAYRTANDGASNCSFAGTILTVSAR